MTRRLRIAQEGQEPVIFDVALVTIGRSASNMLVIKDTRVSSVHGEVVRRGTSFFYRDLGSTNGSMVRTAGRDVVVDGKQVREQLLGDGDALLLGDRYEPVVLSVAILEPEEDAAGSTLVGRRLVTTVDALGTQVVENPLANRQTLSRLLAFYGKIGGTTRPRALTDIVCQTMLELLSKTVFVAAFLKLDGKEERTSLITRDAAHTPLVTPEELHAWFPDAFRGEAAMVIGVPAAVKKRLGQLSQIAAAPLPGESGPLGVAVLGRAATFSDFDLDLLALVAHHGAIQLEKIGLIDKLSHANQHLAAENRDLRHKLDGGAEARPIIGQSHRLQQALKQADLVARTGTTVLVLGETGTGKELVARYIHEHSPRAERGFAAVNCGALAETLLESELFGYVKGAFTGADRDKKGLFQVAHGGTLFLDEIGDISPGLQVKLLRAIEAGEVTPVGSSRATHVDVRIVAATHKDLNREVAEGRFREDLLYRINVFPLELPPLRQRPGDVRLLIEHFLARFGALLGKRPTGIAPEAMARLEGYTWPGNIRELQNEIHRAVLLCEDGAPIGLELLSERIAGAATEVPTEAGPLKETMARVEEQYIRRILEEHGDNRTATAKVLGISRQALTEKLRKYGVAARYGDDE